METGSLHDILLIQGRDAVTEPNRFIARSGTTQERALARSMHRRLQRPACSGDVLRRRQESIGIGELLRITPTGNTSSGYSWSIRLNCFLRSRS